ncbi:MAG: ribosomal protein S18-alanine N-acetyltransferase [Nitrososphaerales archaeon]|nr:ribosomal protein S18-alanine N-acetyltransferase [Nitrososphaerales archaeon]
MQKAVVGRIGEYGIRHCDKDDVQSVISINARTLPEHYSEYFYNEILGEFPETFLVAELNGDVVGYIMCRIEYGFSHLRRLGLARKGHIVSVAVLEEHRGKGIGSRLIGLAQEEMRKKSANECYLEVRVSNTEATRLYQKLGYKTTGRLEAYYKDGEPAYVMAIQIAS